MKVRDVMTAQVETCPADANLSAAAMVMWRRDCGAVPVTEGKSNRIVGIITDRDICMAVATKHCAPETVRAQLEQIVEATGADELIITGQLYDHAARLRSFELVASAGRAAPALAPGGDRGR